MVTVGSRVVFTRDFTQSRGVVLVAGTEAWVKSVDDERVVLKLSHPHPVLDYVGGCAVLLAREAAARGLQFAEYVRAFVSYN